MKMKFKKFKTASKFKDKIKNLKTLNKYVDKSLTLLNKNDNYSTTIDVHPVKISNDYNSRKNSMEMATSSGISSSSIVGIDSSAGAYNNYLRGMGFNDLNLYLKNEYDIGCYENLLEDRIVYYSITKPHIQYSISSSIIRSNNDKKMIDTLVDIVGKIKENIDEAVIQEEAEASLRNWRDYSYSFDPLKTLLSGVITNCNYTDTEKTKIDVTEMGQPPSYLEITPHQVVIPENFDNTEIKRAYKPDGTVDITLVSNKYPDVRVVIQDYENKTKKDKDRMYKMYNILLEAKTSDKARRESINKLLKEVNEVNVEINEELKKNNMSPITEDTDIDYR
jgi:hypothetical protein